MRKYSAVGGIHFGNRVHLRRYGGKKKDQRTASRGAQTAKSSLEMCAYFLLFCLSKKGEELAEWRLASDKKKKNGNSTVETPAQCGLFNCSPSRR